MASKQVEADFIRNEKLGVLKRFPFGGHVIVIWCHRMVIIRKQDRSPRRSVDLSPLNKYWKRETCGSETPFELARRTPKGTFKTVTDDYNGYYGVPLRDSDKLTTFITPFGRFRYGRAPPKLCIVWRWLQSSLCSYLIWFWETGKISRWHCVLWLWIRVSLVEINIFLVKLE